MRVRVARVGRWAMVAFIVVWSLFPVYWAANTSLMTNYQAQSTPAHFLPNPLTLSAYRQLFGVHLSALNPNNLWPDFSRSLVNIVVECGATTVFTVAFAALASYAFARMEFRGKTALFYGVLFTLMLPAYATLIPLYRLMSDVGLVNTYTGIVLVYISGFLPLAMWILYAYFSAIPVALEEAAVIDGASRMAVFTRIILPLAKPGLTATAIIAFLSGWSQFLFPLVLSTDLSTEPLTVFITTLQGERLTQFPLINATGVLTILVPALIVVFLNRYIISGLLAGSVK
jgi:multiple sugar transport system permease protein